MPLYSHPSPLKIRALPPMKFIFLEWARLGQTTAKKKFTSLPWSKDFMMNFRESVTKSRKRTFCVHGLSWQQRKQDRNNVNKNFFGDPQMHIYPLSKFYFEWSCCSGVSWGSLKPPLGQGVGHKHLGRARVKVKSIILWIIKALP